MAAFLTDEWLDQLRESAGAVVLSDEDLRLVVQQVVERGAGLDPVEYVVRVDGGRIAVEGGRAATADLTFTQDEAVALAIHRGELSAQEAFLDGRLHVDAPDPAALARIGALTSLDDVFASARVPELPEIRAHAERLTEDFGGIPLGRFRALTFTALKTAAPAPEAADGQALVAVGQRGKHLLLDFGTVTFVVHLMQGGRLKPDEKQSLKPRNGQARWHFADGRALLLTEAGTERKAGVWVVEGDPEGQAPIEGLGPDADTVDLATLTGLLRGRSMRLHGFLRDQHHVAGLGRLLANEICHRARLSPFASTAKLSDEEVTSLRDAIHSCIDEGLAYERTLGQMSMSADRPASVHHRAGQRCPVCGDEVRAVEYSHYTISYCPTCQTGGKILADNTTSKFLK